jgi:hypothetical protein
MNNSGTILSATMKLIIKVLMLLKLSSLKLFVLLCMTNLDFSIRIKKKNHNEFLLFVIRDVVKDM